MCNTFSPENELEWKLKLYLQKLYGNYIEVERVVSGRGILNVFNFLREYKGNVNPSVLSDVEKAEIDSRPSVISRYAEQRDPTCLEALDIFIDVYARVTGIVACTFLPYSGLYIAGGVLPKVLWRAMEPISPGGHGRFVARYLDAALMSETISRIPLYLLTYDDIGSYGSLYYGFRYLLK